MKIYLKKISITVAMLFSSLVLFLHGYLGHFTRYIADDFCSAFQAGRLGVFRAVWFWYITWSGRYFASILDGVVGRLGPKALPFVVPLTILLWLAALTALLMIFLAQLRSKFLASLALASTTLFVLFLRAPDIKGSLYWGQGMRSVVPPLIMGTIQLLFFKILRAKEWTRFSLVLWGILSFSWALVTGGFSETYETVGEVLCVGEQQSLKALK